MPRRRRAVPRRAAGCGSPQGVSAAPGAGLLLVRLPGALPRRIGRGARAPVLGWPGRRRGPGGQSRLEPVSGSGRPGVPLATAAPPPWRGPGVTGGVALRGTARVFGGTALARDRHAAPGPPARPGTPGAGALVSTGTGARRAVLASLAEVFQFFGFEPLAAIGLGAEPAARARRDAQRAEQVLGG